MLKTDKQKRVKASILALALAAMPMAIQAAGVGKLTVVSAMGQPLRAEIDLTASREEYGSISARMASPDAFKNAGIEYSPILSAIRFTLGRRPNGQPYLQVQSDRPLNEPFIDMLVEVSWASGRLVREFTFLLDPPDVFTRQQATTLPVAAPEVVKASASAETTLPRETEAPAAAKPTEARVGRPADEKASRRSIGEGARDSRVEAVRPSEKIGDESATRVVKRGDTLAKIAGEIKPDGVSLDQMLVALFRGNKDAFDAGNMNRLRTGKILSLPDKEAAVGLAQGEARKVVIAQAADFNAYRRKLAAAATAAPARDDAPKQVATGKIAPRVEEKTVEPTVKDKLEVSRTESAKPGTSRPAGVAEEDLIARDKALKEANRRVADLEKNITDLKKLAEMKSVAGAKLQDQAPAAKPGAVEKKAEPEMAAKASAPVPPAAVAPELPVPEPVKEPAKAAVAVAPPQSIPVAPAAAVKKAPAPLPLPPAAPAGFIEENRAIIFGGGGLLALIAGYFGFNAWRRRRGEGDEPPSSLVGSELSASSVFGVSGGQKVDTGATPPTDFSKDSAIGATGGEGVDPVAEAEVYMAYGRDGQAEEILVEALRTDPFRTAIHLKLLEIYAARKTAKPFEAVARDLHGLTTGSGPDWGKAAALGRALDPENPLYGRAETPALAASAAESVVPDAAETRDAPADTVVMPRGLSQMAAAAEQSMSSATEEEPLAVLDFDLDLGSASPDVAPTSEPEAVTGLDFDLDLTSPAAAEVMISADTGTDTDTGLDFNLGTMTFQEPPRQEVPPPVAKTAVEEDSGGLDFDLGTMTFQTPPAQASEAAPELAGSSALDFDFDLGNNLPGDSPSTEDLVAEGAALGSEFVRPELDLSSINLDLDLPAEAPAVKAGSDIVDNPEVATKLELAQAYEEMGDKEGARELLNEVLNDGSPSQQNLARDKLAQLA